jgi:hypothetical protein
MESVRGGIRLPASVCSKAPGADISIISYEDLHMNPDSAPAEPDESRETKKPKTYGEPFIVPESGEDILEQMPSRADQRLSENLPDTQKN